MMMMESTVASRRRRRQCWIDIVASWTVLLCAMVLGNVSVGTPVTAFLLLSQQRGMQGWMLSNRRWNQSFPTSSSVCVKAGTDSDDNNNNTDDPLDIVQNEKFLERNKRWVVLVDDEQSIRMAVGDYLYDQGYKVTACVDANALLEVVTTPPSEDELSLVPDAIVCDVRMPGTNGIELVKIIRGSKRLQRVPIVMLTARTFTKDRIAGYKAGADVYLTKPFNPEELLSVVDNMIVRRQQMVGKEGKLADFKAELLDIKQILRINSENKVKETDVYLTSVERDVLELMCLGLSNQEISNRRNVGIARTRAVLQNMYVKTETRTRTELLRWALRTGYVSRTQLQKGLQEKERNDDDDDEEEEENGGGNDEDSDGNDDDDDDDDEEASKE